MTAFLTADFSGSAGANLSTKSGWTKVNSGDYLLDGSGGTYAGGGGASYINSATPGSNEHDITVNYHLLTFSGGGANEFEGGITFGDDGAALASKNAYGLIRGFQDQRLQLVKWVNGTRSFLATAVNGTLTQPGNNSLTIQRRVTGITVILGGSTVLTSNDATITAVGNIGLFAQGGADTLTGGLHVESLVGSNVTAPLVAGTVTSTVQTATTVTLAATGASGGSGTRSYQWKISTNGGSSYSNLSGQTGATSAVATGLTASTSYKFKQTVTDDTGPADSNVLTQSTGAALSVAAPTVVYLSSSSASVPSATAAGGDPAYTYQLQTSADGSTGWANAGAAGNTGTATLTPGTPLWARFHVTDSLGATANSPASKMRTLSVFTAGATDPNTVGTDSGDQPDHLYHFDGDAEAAVADGRGSLSRRTSMSVVAGRYAGTSGITVSVSAFSAPALIPYGCIGEDEFHIRFHLKSGVAWSSIVGDVFAITSDTATLGLYHFANGMLQTSYGHTQGPDASDSYSGAAAMPAVSIGAYAQFDISFKNGSLKTYVNGTLVTTVAVANRMKRWGARGIGDGITLLGDSGAAQTDLTLGGLDIYRYARVPGTPLAVPAPSNVLTVTATPAGTLPADFFGTGGWTTTQFTRDAAAGVVRTLHADHVAQAPPAKVGSTDGTHPTLGHSGSYSYDWQHIDRCMTFYFSTLGLTSLSLALGGTHQLFGGAVAPASGARLTTDNQIIDADFPNNYAPEVPSDFDGQATLCADIVHHVEVTLGYAGKVNWTTYNEPDGSASFWAGTAAQFRDLHGRITAAVKAAVPAAKIGGPSTAGYNGTFGSAFIASEAGAGRTPSFYDSHHYTADTGETYRQRAQLDSWAATSYGAATHIDLISTEIGFYQPMLFGAPAPFDTVDIGNGAWMAAFHAAFAVDAFAAGYTQIARFIFVRNSALFSSGMVDDDHVLAGYNLARVMGMLGTAVLSSTYDGAAGVWHLATLHANGNYRVLVAQLRWRADREIPLTITLPAGHGTVTQYTIDAGHSNYFEAGAGHEALEASGGSLAVTLKPQQVLLLDISPSTGGAFATSGFNYGFSGFGF